MSHARSVPLRRRDMFYILKMTKTYMEDVSSKLSETRAKIPFTESSHTLHNTWLTITLFIYTSPSLAQRESKSYFRSNLGSLKTSQSQWNLLASFLRLTSTATLLKSVILVKSLKGMSRGFQWLQRTLVKLAVLISIQGLGFGEEEGGEGKEMQNQCIIISGKKFKSNSSAFRIPADPHPYTF